MKNTLYILVIPLILSSSGIQAQNKDNISAEETVAYINGKVQGIAQLKINRGQLVVEFFRNGKVNRVDRVPVEALNPDDVDYLADEKAIVVRCIAQECIQRKVEQPKTIGNFSRLSFTGDFDEKTQKGLIKAFEHLILLFRDNKYKNNTPFE